MTDPNPVLLAQHDARLDLFVTKLTSALHESTTTPTSLADHALKLAQDASYDSSDFHRREILTRALNKTLLQEIQRSAGFSEKGALRLVDASIELARRDKILRQVPAHLLEVLFVSHSQKRLVEAIPAIRTRFEALRGTCTSRLSDAAYAIKSITSCMRQDSRASSIRNDFRATNPIFFGHLYLMLDAALPPWHPSCARRQMSYSVTVFDEALAPYDLENAVKGQSSRSTMDIPLYRSFWTAYAAMKNPSLAESPAHWRHISACMDRVLSAFRTVPPIKELDELFSNGSAEHKGRESKAEMDTTATESEKQDSKHNKTITVDGQKKQKYKTRIPKHLTSPSILRLQIEDIKIRRHVLVQYAIFLHHLEVVSQQQSTEKDNAASKAGMDFCKTLFVPGGEGTRLKKSIFDIMSSDDGANFKHYVSGLLQRERHWINWKKNTGYGHLRRTSSVAPSVFKRRKVRSKISKYATESNRSTDNAPWRMRQSAWVVPPAKERAQPLLERAQAELWSEDVLKMELKEDMDDADVTDSMKRKNDSKYVWRTLRMLCEENLQCITSVAQRDGTLDLEALIKTKQEPRKSGGSEGPGVKKTESVASK